MARTSRVSYASAYGYSTEGNTALAASTAPQRTRQPRPERERRVRVIPGRNGDAERNKALSPDAVFWFRVVIVAVIALGIMGVGRVWMSMQTVRSMETIEALESQIELAQEEGSNLEIQHSVLASPQRIEEQASLLGMAEPESVTRLTVSLPAHVVTNDDGTASFFRTIKTVENAALGAQ